MFNKKFIIPYGKQWIGQEDIEAVVEVLKGDWLTQGPKVEEFEKAIASYCQVKYAVAFSSGTAALHGAYSVLGVKPGDEIIAPPMTFSGTTNGAVYCGARPVFVDIKLDTLNIDPAKIEEKISPKTKAIAIVDFAGQPCDFQTIKEIAQKHNLPIVEDAAHALGSEYKNKKVGSMADLTILSFHPVKTITSGEGGMVLTNSEELANRLKNFRHHGIVKKPEIAPWYYEIENLGYNYRLTDIHCALGLSQLKKLDKFVERRREIVKKYQEAFSAMEEIILIKEEDFAKSAWHIYPIQLDLTKLKVGRREIFEQLGQKGIKAQVHYVPVHFMPFYQKEFGYKKGDFPVAEKYYERAITLPLYPRLSDEELDYVIESVKEVVNANKK